MIQLPVVEIFSSLQGEGIHSGTISTFIRLGGCNLKCSFCDTDFSKAELMTVKYVENAVCQYNNTLVVITGGEPLIHDQLNILLSCLKNNGYLIEIETNGTLPLDDCDELVDFISLSPKVPREFCSIKACDSLKILYPYLDNSVSGNEYKSFPATERYIQPIDGMNKYINTQAAIEEVKHLGYPWKLGIQLHKMIGVK
jgi:organic radical activating enzyme